jgi:RNA polymerase sigma factor (sigma-70 family)
MNNQYNNILISQMCEPLTEELNLELLPQVVAGNVAAREQMITGNMALVLRKVEAFIHCFPTIVYLRDDLISAGFMGLTKAVNAVAARVKIENVFNYILTAIDHELGKLIDVEHTIRIPGKSRRAAKASDKPLIPPTCVNILPERFVHGKYETELEFRDLLDSCCCNEDERTFLRMREEGYTPAEIAEVVGKSIGYIYYRSKRLAARIDEALRK